MSTPSVGIVAVNYNSAGFIGDFLDSLDTLDYPNSRLIVVDAASRDGSADEIARRRPDAELIRCDENVGIARGNNLGAARCRDHGLDYILFLNNDTTHEPDFLRLAVCLHVEISTFLDIEILDRMPTGRGAHFHGPFRFPEQIGKAASESFRAPGGNHEPGNPFLNHFPHIPDISGDHGQAARHGFHEAGGRPLLSGRKDEQIEAWQEILDPAPRIVESEAAVRM